MKNSFSQVAVLDTNVLIDNPRAILSFPDTLVVIPLTVLEELDKLKDDKDARVRRMARYASNLIDSIAEENEDEEIYRLENGSYLVVEVKFQGEFDTDEPSKPDNKIISVAVGYAKKYAEDGIITTLYSNDTNVRNMTRAIARKVFSGKSTKDHLPLKTKHFALIDNSLEDIDSGVRDIITSEKNVSTLRVNGKLEMELDYINGEHIILRAETNLDNAVLATYDAVHKRLVALPDYKKGEPIWRIGQNDYGAENVRPRDARQTFLAHDILDTSKNLHFVLSRVAGAGKNYIVTACALNLLKRGEYDRLIIIKPMYEVDGEKTGFLPGTKEEKIAPWFESFNDTMYELTAGRGLDTELGSMVEMDIVTHMRGRSIPRTIMIIDEAQNFSEDALKTLLTRAGEGSKFILMGDLSQIDNPRLDSSNCGLRIWAERARRKEVGYEKSTYILLDSNYRSDLSAWASSFYE